jgi:exosortase
MLGIAQSMSVATTQSADTAGRMVVVAAGFLGVLVLALYRAVLPSWVADLWNDPNYSHGLLVPFVSGWLAYRRRADLAALRPQPAASALLLVLASLGLLLAALLAAELFTMRLSLLLLLTGLLAFILGYAYVRVLALPLAFLLFMVPLPALVWNAVAFPLQLLASQLAVALLQGVGVPALREGNVILLPNISLEVVEACSGLRSLVSLGALSVLLAVLSLRGYGSRIALVLSSVLVAVVANGARVAITGVLADRWGPQLAQGFLHLFSGWVVFVVALLLLGGEAAVLRRLEGS